MHVPRPARPRAALAAGAIAALTIGVTLTLDPGGALAVASAPVAACTERLSTIEPTGVAGDPLAVAVTAQTLAADTPGWVDVSWEAGPGHTISTVLVTSADGEVAAVDGAPTGRATATTSLTFCGTAEVSATDTDTEAIR